MSYCDECIITHVCMMSIHPSFLVVSEESQLKKHSRHKASTFYPKKSHDKSHVKTPSWRTCDDRIYLPFSSVQSPPSASRFLLLVSQSLFGADVMLRQSYSPQHYEFYFPLVKPPWSVLEGDAVFGCHHCQQLPLCEKFAVYQTEFDGKVQ